MFFNSKATPKSANDYLAAVLAICWLVFYVSLWATFGNISLKSRTKITNLINFSITYGFNTQFRYNPFAGSFTETLLIEGDVVCEDGKLSLKLSEMVIVYVYAGYGVKQERKTIAQMKEEIAANDAIQADATAKKKAKKEAKNNNKDLTESLQSAIDEIAKRIIDPLTAAVNK